MNHQEAFEILMSLNVNRISMEEAKRFLEDELEAARAENEWLNFQCDSLGRGLQERSGMLAKAVEELAAEKERAEKAEEAMTAAYMLGRYDKEKPE